MDYREIASLIKNSKKKTQAKFFIKLKNKIELNDKGNIHVYGKFPDIILIGEFSEIKRIIDEISPSIEYYDYEIKARNSALPMCKIENVNSRIEPGAIIRDGVSIGKNCVIMMGAVINIGSVIDDETMIDMNAVIGARGTIGKKCHIGAGAVIAGVLEPPSATPVIIEDNVMIGANAVVLEGVRIGKNSVIGACSVVTEDIPENSVAVGIPAKIVKKKDKKTSDKTQILKDLR